MVVKVQVNILRDLKDMSILQEIYKDLYQVISHNEHKT